MAKETSLTTAGLDRLICRFYERVRHDPELGPAFEAGVADWAEHLERLSDFWSSVTLTSGRYEGSPVAVHLSLRARPTPRLFTRWLELWGTSVDELFVGAPAEALRTKADRIAESLLLAMIHQRPATIAA